LTKLILDNLLVVRGPKQSENAADLLAQCRRGIAERTHRINFDDVGSAKSLVCDVRFSERCVFSQESSDANSQCSDLKKLVVKRIVHHQYRDSRK
jgi:hypothetical protein